MSASRSAFSRVAGRPCRSRSTRAATREAMRGWSAASVAAKGSGGFMESESNDSDSVTLPSALFELLVDDVRDARELGAADIAGDGVAAVAIDPVEDRDVSGLHEAERRDRILVRLAGDVHR